MENLETQTQPKKRRASASKRPLANGYIEVPSLDIEVAKLQVHTDHLLGAISSVNARIDKVSTKIDKVETSINARIDRVETSIGDVRKEVRLNLFWTMGIMFTGFAAMLAAMARGFGWIG